ncbi:LytR/AlgR family response regulator transcription factor [Crocinitomix algicola]|uniref:LytR/AlgR family response regulator transcription factor n=1 Tax=Crocinitomix algicola TaxID=1740263 RepID=UPI000872BCF0|nr:LytTR family DNA-binding domain-containing protein [Crocinitomix algicola]
MNCLILEDQAPAQRVLMNYIERDGRLRLIDVFTSPLKASAFFLAHPHQQIDLLFLDIHLPHQSGIDFLKTMENPPAVVLTTAFSNYAVQGFDLNVLDYLVKPFSYPRFQQAIEKFVQQYQYQSKSLFVKSGHEMVRVNPSEIVYIHSDMDYTELYLLNDKKLLTNETLGNWEILLEEEGFYRIHKSYLINSHQILKVSKTQVVLSNKTVLTIGRAFKSKFFSAIEINN